MTHTLDFLFYAYRKSEFKEQLIEHMQMEEDSKIPYDGAWLGFDSKNKLIWQYPREGAMFSWKIDPLIITYDSFYRFIDCEDPLNHFTEKEYKGVMHEKYKHIIVICADEPEDIEIPDFEKLIKNSP